MLFYLLFFFSIFQCFRKNHHIIITIVTAIIVVVVVATSYSVSFTDFAEINFHYSLNSHITYYYYCCCYDIISYWNSSPYWSFNHFRDFIIID